jgi:Acetyltransferase (GNAT) domain
MSARLTTRYLTEADYPDWNQIVAASPDGSIYSTPEYLDVLCSETDAHFRILVAERAGEIVGGIALYERKSFWGRYLRSRYLLYYNGFVLKRHPSKYPSERTSRQVETLSALEEAISETGYGRVLIKGRGSQSDVRVFLDRGWSASPSYTYVVPLADLTDLWTRVEQNLRRLVTRCGREGFQFSDDDDFESFYRLHHQTHVRKGSSIYLPEAGFRRYFERLKSQNLCRLFHARTAEGRVVSSQLVLMGKHPVCHTVSAAADAEFLRTGCTAFLRWKGFEQLAQLGYTGTDLTDAQLSPVTHFKSQLGGNLETNFVLGRPDRSKFRVEKFVYRSGSMVKGGARAVVASLKRTRGDTSGAAA